MTTFASLGVREDILRALEELEFTTPTPVQERIIPMVLENSADLVALAQTGTGKTAAFGIPLLQKTEPGRRVIQSLVLCPTRELCVQVAKDLSAFSAHIPGLNILAVYGGAGIDRQISSLRRGVQVLVATPGRLHDLLRRDQVDLSGIRSVVLDEADEMLQMGFLEDLNVILGQTPADRNTLLFSATMSSEVATIARNYMVDAQEITVGRKNGGAENVRHVYYMVQARDRYPALRRIADTNPRMYAIVFCRTRQETREVADNLMRDGYNADVLSGDLSQAQRDQVMQKFRNRNLQMLVATDVAARGLDVNDLTHVINYNLPDDIAAYTHRSGRTGRAGKTGTSIAIIHLREKYRIKEIETRIKKKFEQGTLPSGREVCEQKLLNLTETIKEVVVNEERLTPFMPALAASLAGLDREELIRRIISLQCNHVLEHYRNAPDLNAAAGHAERKPARDGRPVRGESFKESAGRPQFARFYLNVGKNDGVHATRLIGEINEATGYPFVRLGRIEISHSTAMLEADSRFTHKVLGAFQSLMINGKPVTIEVGDRGGRSDTGGPGGFRESRSRKFPKKETFGDFRRGKRKPY